MKTIKVVAAIIEKDNKILVAKRSYGEFAGFWEFPGGKYEEGETGEQAIKREIEEEFDVEIKVNQYLCTVEYQYDAFYLVMDCYRCSLITDNLVLHDHSDIRWIDCNQNDIVFLPADEIVIQKYREDINHEK